MPATLLIEWFWINLFCLPVFFSTSVADTLNPITSLDSLRSPYLEVLQELIVLNTSVNLFISLEVLACNIHFLHLNNRVSGVFWVFFKYGLRITAINCISLKGIQS